MDKEVLLFSAVLGVAILIAILFITLVLLYLHTLHKQVIKPIICTFAKEMDLNSLNTNDNQTTTFMKIRLDVYNHVALQFLDGKKMEIEQLPEYGELFDVCSLLSDEEKQLEMDEINPHCKYTGYAGLTVEEFFEEAKVTVNGVYPHQSDDGSYVVELKMDRVYSETGGN